MAIVKTRSYIQIRSHAQKYFSKLKEFYDIKDPDNLTINLNEYNNQEMLVELFKKTTKKKSDIIKKIDKFLLYKHLQRQKENNELDSYISTEKQNLNKSYNKKSMKNCNLLEIFKEEDDFGTKSYNYNNEINDEFTYKNNKELIFNFGEERPEYKNNIQNIESEFISYFKQEINYIRTNTTLNKKDEIKSTHLLSEINNNLNNSADIHNLLYYYYLETQNANDETGLQPSLQKIYDFFQYLFNN